MRIDRNDPKVAADIEKAGRTMQRLRAQLITLIDHDEAYRAVIAQMQKTDDPHVAQLVKRYSLMFLEDTAGPHELGIVLAKVLAAITFSNVKSQRRAGEAEQLDGIMTEREHMEGILMLQINRIAQVAMMTSSLLLDKLGERK